MATAINFHGKTYIEPGAYAVSVYNPTSVVNVAEYGNCMIIDTGLSMTADGYEFSGGSGINGELNQGLKSVYQFDNYEDFLAFIGGGPIGDIAQKLFEPKAGSLGVPKLYYTRAAATTAAKIELELEASSGGGTEEEIPAQKLILTCKNEGVTGNAVIDDGNLKLGYAARIVAGTEDNTKFKLQILQGSFMGVDADGEPYGAKSFANANYYIFAESEEFTKKEDLVNWCKNNKTVLANFKVTTSGTITGDLAAVSQVGATGGTTDYLDATAYANVLESISELDITFFLCCNTTVSGGTDVSTNGKLFTFLKNDAKFTQFMVVPGGSGDDDLLNTPSKTTGTSQAIAKYFDSEQVVVVHGAPVVPRKDGNGTKVLSPIYLAATIIGMAAGGAPQVPLTFKRTGYDNFKYTLKKKEREKALQAGIMHVRNINGYWCINQGVTTLQDNKQTYAADGQSLELSIALIKAQLNKEMIIDASDRFAGGNVGTYGPADIKNFVETELQSLTVSGGEDNLIVDWKNVKVTAKNTDFFATYDFVPNIPLNKVFFTGNVLDFTAIA